MQLTSKTVELSLPEILRKEIETVPETGLYASEAEFIIDGVRTLLSARKDVRLAVACRMYEKGEASLSGAADVAETDIETMKAALAELDIPRKSSASVEEVEEMASIAARASGRL